MTTPPPPDQHTPEVPDAEPGEAPSAPATKRKRKWKRYLAIALLSPLLAFVLYTLMAYNWSYSNGYRSGFLRKFSRKGWLCKTWEGELALTTMPGVMPELWTFTVRNDSVAGTVNAALGKQVVLHYAEHRGLWSDCFGETQYFVDSVRLGQ
jgi:hypothetical protein